MEWEQIELSISKSEEKKEEYLPENIRIRKLTPKECYRLMAFCDDSFNKAKFKHETIYFEGGDNQCGAKLKVVTEKQRQKDTETYVLCTTSDLQGLAEILTEWTKYQGTQGSEFPLNVSFAIEKSGRMERLECATSTTKCIDFMGMHFLQIKKCDQHRMVIIAQGNEQSGNTGRYMKITTESSLTPTKLFIILTLFAQIIELKIFGSTIVKANIQGCIANMKDCGKNILMQLLSLRMDTTSERMSNSSLYKQAGNSICVNCLEAIFGQMFEGKENRWKVWCSSPAYKFSCRGKGEE